MISDINMISQSGAFPSHLTLANNKLFFLATDNGYSDALWVSDGTSAGTIRLKDSVGAPAHTELTAVGNSVFFNFDGELWRSDGTITGPVAVTGHLFAQSLTAADGKLFFVGDDGIHGEELWMSDGTSAGTVMVRDVKPGPMGSYPDWLTAIGDTLFFSAYVGANGQRKLLKSDGTPANTVVVRDSQPEIPLNPRSLTNVAGTLFFDAGYDHPSARGVWRSDGTAAGTIKLKEWYNGQAPDKITDVAGTAFFLVSGATQIELWKSDGTPAGTVLVRRIPGIEGYTATKLTAVHRTLFFRARDNTHGMELWKSDGTELGTQMFDIHPGAGDSSPDHLVGVDRALFFEADDGIHGAEMWRSDGTLDGTRLYADINSGPASAFQLDAGWASDMMNANGTLFFGADDGSHGNELWRLDFCRLFVLPWFS